MTTAVILLTLGIVLATVVIVMFCAIIFGSWADDTRAIIGNGHVLTDAEIEARLHNSHQHTRHQKSQLNRSGGKIEVVVNGHHGAATTQYGGTE